MGLKIHFNSKNKAYLQNPNGHVLANPLYQIHPCCLVALAITKEGISTNTLSPLPIKRLYMKLVYIDGFGTEKYFDIY